MLFAPPPRRSIPRASPLVTVSGLTEVLCGDPERRRGPEHFEGVATVVTKLFNMAQPDVGLLRPEGRPAGARDPAPRPRPGHPRPRGGLPHRAGGDGLALSSRNAYLDAEERSRALALSRALRAAEATVAGAASPPPARCWPRRARELDAAGVDPEYMELRSAKDLSPVERVNGSALLAVAARVGRARLIDNTILRSGMNTHKHPLITRPGQRRPGAAPPAQAPGGDALDARRQEGARRAHRNGHGLRLPQRAGGRGGRRGHGPRGRLRGHDRARLPSTVPVTLDELLMLAAAVRRGLSTPLLVGDLPFGSYEVSNEDAIRYGAALRQGGRLRRREARARRHLRRARPRDRGRRHPGDGTRGPHSADGHGAGRLPLAGPHRRARPRGDARRDRAPGGRLLRGRVRGDPQRAHRARDAAHARSR